MSDQLPIPDGPRTIAYRAIETVLRSDPDLARFVKTWWTRTGDPVELNPPAFDLCPLIGLSPAPRPDGRATIESAVINMEVWIDTFVKGSRIDDAMNLWDLIAAAMELRRPFPGTDKSVFDYLRCELPRLRDGSTVSIADWQLTTPAFLPYVPSRSTKAADEGKPGDPGMLNGTGILSFNFIRRR